MISCTYLDANSQNVSSVYLDEMPDVCSHCGIVQKPITLGTYCDRVITGNMYASDVLDMVCRCTANKCGRTFVVEYRRTGFSDNYFYRVYRYHPFYCKYPPMQDSLKEKYPEFYKIWKQACDAEAYGLTEIAGPAFRKSLEYLLKDYLVRQKGVEKEEIAKKQLWPVIKEYFKGEKRVQEAAKLCTWILNDETHYEKRWEDKDLEDAKRLLLIVRNFIDDEVALGEHRDSMTPQEKNGKKPEKKLV